MAQTQPAYEIIVIDDGSSKCSPLQLQSDYPQVKFHRQTHAGVSRARNFGVELAQGDWIALLDSDDLWLPQKLVKQCQAIEASGLMLSHTDEIWIRDGVRVNPHKKHRKYGGDIFRHCLPLCAISPSSVLIERQLYTAIGGFDEALPACEDYDLWLRITAKHKVDFIKQPLVIKHGGHADQLSRQYWGMDRFRIYAMEKLLNQNQLTQDQCEQLLAQLVEKCRIYATGAKKNNNAKDFDLYREKYQQYLSLSEAP